jgi:hypothetical protein
MRRRDSLRRGSVAAGLTTSLMLIPLLAAGESGPPISEQTAVVLRWRYAPYSIGRTLFKRSRAPVRARRAVTNQNV